jgi:hypothetical protein
MVLRIAQWIVPWHGEHMPAPHLDDVLLRTARADDEADLVRLAALDSARPLPGPALVAEADGTIVAALCLTTGRAVADPFTCSLHLVAFLRRVQEARGRSRGP